MADKENTERPSDSVKPVADVSAQDAPALDTEPKADEPAPESPSDEITPGLNEPKAIEHCDIFISYAREDHEKANLLIKIFRKLGWKVFVDMDIPIGERFPKTIEEQLQAAKVVVVLWSKTSRESVYVVDEADRALAREVLKPVLLDDSMPPLGFGRLTTANLSDWPNGNTYEHPELHKLLKNIEDIAPRPKQPAPPPTAEAPPQIDDRRRIMPLFISALLMACIFASYWFLTEKHSFIMGSPTSETGRDEREMQHKVTFGVFSTGFEMQAYEVTFAEYDTFADQTQRPKPDDEGWGRGKRPVINVSWHDAVAYAQWLSEETGEIYRLPTEAEWEYAARAGTNTAYWWGNEISADLANYGEHNHKTLEIGSYKENPFGIYDVHGNVWEWTQDCWHENYDSAPNDGRAWGAEDNGNCDRRVVRGGSWRSTAHKLRSAKRSFHTQSHASDYIGFRLVKEKN